MDTPRQLTARDITHRAMLRSTIAMIQNRWPGEYDRLAQRLEELTWRIEGTNLADVCRPTDDDEHERRNQQQLALLEGS